MPIRTEHYTPGRRVRVVQQIARSREPWTSTIEGEIVSYEQSRTGSWFAHSKGDRLWLDRLTLRKADGEMVVCNLDQYSRIEPLN
jgi:succinylglutamate desuccinylase